MWELTTSICPTLRKAILVNNENSLQKLKLLLNKENIIARQEEPAERWRLYWYNYPGRNALSACDG